MPQPCSVCQHRERGAIDRALVAGEPARTVASRYVTLGRMAVQRHKENHLPASLVKAQEAAEVAHADDLLSQVRDLRDKALGILTKAERAGDLKTALLAIREARAT